jgi:hypothetical protein
MSKKNVNVYVGDKIKYNSLGSKDWGIIESITVSGTITKARIKLIDLNTYVTWQITKHNIDTDFAIIPTIPNHIREWKKKLSTYQKRNI